MQAANSCQIQVLEEHIINPFEFAFGGVMVVFDLEGGILPMTVSAQGE